MGKYDYFCGRMSMKLLSFFFFCWVCLGTEEQDGTCQS